MAHVRQSLRSALQTTLAGMSTTGARVYFNRATSVHAADLPALLIGVGEKTVKLVSRLYERNLVVKVQAVVALAGDPEQVINQILAELEARLGTDLTLSGTVAR